jgi:transcriptional regulator with XRE-family HTH domain
VSGFIGDNLKSLRIWHSHTQKSLSELVGITERDIWQFENGYKSPDLNEINALKTVFNVKAKYFYTEDIIGRKGNYVDPAHISFRYYGK